MTYEEHIAGLMGIKDYMQKMLRKTNYEGMGEQDADECGETIDLAIECIEKQIATEPEIQYFDNKALKKYCPYCGTDITFKTWNYCQNCGQHLKL